MFIIGKGATYNRSLLIYIIMCTPNVPLQKQRRCFALPTPMFQRNNAVVSNQAHRGIFILSQISNIIQRSHRNHGNHRKANAMFVDMKKLAAWLSVISVFSVWDKLSQYPQGIEPVAQRRRAGSSMALRRWLDGVEAVARKNLRNPPKRGMFFI